MLPHYRRNHQVTSSDGGPGRGVGWLPPYATIFILVVGVAGGLIIIIAIILFCKCCIQMEKDIRRKLYSIKRQKHCLGHYVSLDCTGSSSKECDDENKRRIRRNSASSVDSSIIEQSLAEDTNLDLENEIDFVVAKYKEGIQETILDEYDSCEVPNNPGSRGHGVAAVLPAAGVTPCGPSPVGRASGQSAEEADREEDSSNSTPIEGSSSNEKHVSFLLTEKSGSFGGYGGRGISKPHRCTEGDYHQLKHVKIDRSSAFVRMVRQPSLGSLGLDRPHPASFFSSGFMGGGAQDTTVTIESTTSFKATDQSLLVAKERKCVLGGRGFYSSGGHRTEVVVDVHPGPRSDLPSMTDGQRSAASSETKQTTLAVPVKAEEQTRGGRRQSMSLEIPQGPERASPRETRRVRSYEEYNNKTGTRDYDRNKITQFIRKPLFNNDLLDEKEGSAAQSKVRYNDTGSFEEVDEEKAELLDKTFSSVEEKRFPGKTLKYPSAGGELEKETSKDGGCRMSENYQEIWNLRATFEEEEEMAAIIRIEDTSPEDLQSPSEADRSCLAPVTGGASRVQGYKDADDARNGRQDGRFPASSRGLPGVGRTSENHLLFPDSETRRQTYRNVIARRMCRINSSAVGAGPSLSKAVLPGGHASIAGGPPVTIACTGATNSFDSAETMETDGEISDTSRHDLTTTSFESTTTTTTTTENTDSTGDGQAAHKAVSGMRGDSGYKSLEAQHSLPSLSSARTSATAAAAAIAHAGLAPDSSSAGEIQVVVAHPPPSMALSKIPETTVTLDTSQAERRTPKAPHRSVAAGARSSAAAPFDRRNTKTASKKRRDYRAERHLAYDSLSEPGSAGGSGGGGGGGAGASAGAVCSTAGEHSGDSFEEYAPSSSSSSVRRLSVLPRFLRYHIRATTCARAHRMSRDYSVDERTDALYNEFLRYDPALDRKSSLLSFGGFHRWQRVHCSSSNGGGGGGYQQQQQQHQHQPLTDQSLDVGFKRHHLRLTSNLRSATYAGEGKGSSFRRLSPQDSIEEELAGAVAAEGPQGLAMMEPSVRPRSSTRLKEIGVAEVNDSSSFDVPVIRLPDDDVQT